MSGHRPMYNSDTGEWDAHRPGKNTRTHRERTIYICILYIYIYIASPHSLIHARTPLTIYRSHTSVHHNHIYTYSNIFHSPQQFLGAAFQVEIEPLMKQYNVDLYLCGHMHMYERYVQGRLPGSQERGRKGGEKGGAEKGGRLNLN